MYSNVQQPTHQSEVLRIEMGRTNKDLSGDHRLHCSDELLWEQQQQQQQPLLQQY